MGPPCKINESQSWCMLKSNRFPRTYLKFSSSPWVDSIFHHIQGHIPMMFPLYIECTNISYVLYSICIYIYVCVCWLYSFTWYVHAYDSQVIAPFSFCQSDPLGSHLFPPCRPVVLWTRSRRRRNFRKAKMSPISAISSALRIYAMYSERSWYHWYPSSKTYVCIYYI